MGMINIKTLQRELSMIPTPEFVDQRHVLRITNRFEDIKLELPFYLNDDVVNSEFSYTPVCIVAVKYCRSRYDCWLEWELDV